MTDFAANRSVFADIIANLRANEEPAFVEVGHVSVTASRSDADWTERVDAMVTHCARTARGRWLWRAPMDQHAVQFVFEDHRDLVEFRLSFG